MADARCVLHHSHEKSSEHPHADLETTALAARQHGVVATRQLEALGLGRSRIEIRVKRGGLHPVHRGVYAVGTGCLTLEGRWMAAVLACGSGAVLSHRSAAQLWGILPRSRRRPEVTRPRSFRSLPGIRAHRSPLADDETDEHDAIPVTSLSRTLLDLAGVLDTAGLERALNEIEVLGLTDRLPFEELLRRHPRRPGAPALRTALGDRRRTAGVSRSELERLFVELLRDHGLPLPRLNASVIAGSRALEVDCLWHRARLVVELDGRRFHDTVTAFEGDRIRDRLLVAAGWRVLRITWRQVHVEGRAIAAQLAGLLGVEPPDVPRRPAAPNL